MKKLLKLLIALTLVFSVLMLASCDDDETSSDDYPWTGDGIEGPIIPYD